MDNVTIFGYTDNWLEPTPNKMNFVIQRWKTKLEMCSWNTCLQAYLYMYFHFRILLLNFSVATSKFNEHCSINLEMSSAKRRPLSSGLCVKRLSIKHFKWKKHGNELQCRTNPKSFLSNEKKLPIGIEISIEFVV